MRRRVEVFLSCSLALLLVAIAVSVVLRGPGKRAGPLRGVESFRAAAPKLLEAVGPASSPSERPGVAASDPADNDKAEAEAGTASDKGEAEAGAVWGRYISSDFPVRVTCGGLPVEGARIATHLWHPVDFPQLSFDCESRGGSGPDGMAMGSISYRVGTAPETVVYVCGYHPGVGLGFREWTLGDLVAAAPGELEVQLETGRPVMGRVLGPDGAPIEGACVSVGISGHDWRRFVPVLHVLTGKDGRFEIWGILSEDYPVYVLAFYGQTNEPPVPPKVLHPGVPPTPEEIRWLLGREWIVGPFDGRKPIAKEMLDAEAGIWDVGDIHLEESSAIDASAMEEPPVPPVDGERAEQGN